MILRQAATSMLTSLDSYELGLQSMHNFLKTLPGYTWYKRHDAALDCMHRPLAAMLPVFLFICRERRGGKYSVRR